MVYLKFWTKLHFYQKSVRVAWSFYLIKNTTHYQNPLSQALPTITHDHMCATNARYFMWYHWSWASLPSNILVVLLLFQASMSMAEATDRHSYHQANESQRVRIKLHQGLTKLSYGKEAHYQGKEGSSHCCCPLRQLSCERAASCFCCFLSVLFVRLKSSPFSYSSLQNNIKNPISCEFLIYFLYTSWESRSYAFHL